MDAEKRPDLSVTRDGQNRDGGMLYIRYLNGDRDAFVLLIEQYKDPLMLFIRTFVKNMYIAEDLTQETFVCIGLDKPRFNGKSDFKTWLYAIGRNVSLKYLRRHSREIASDICPDGSRGDETDIETQYLKEADRIAVHRAMDRLPAPYRQVLWLSYFEGLDNTAIAGIMKKSKHTVETLKYRAKQALRTTLEKEGFLYENG